MNSECQYLFWMQSENILRVVAASDPINVRVHKITHRIETKLAVHSGIKAGFLSFFHMQCIHYNQSVPILKAEK